MQNPEVKTIDPKDLPRIVEAPGCTAIEVEGVWLCTVVTRVIGSIIPGPTKDAAFYSPSEMASRKQLALDVVTRGVKPPAHMQLAQAVIAASTLREESYDTAAAEAYTAEQEAVPIERRIMDYEQFYRLTLREACEQASKEFSEPVFLLLHSNWNDALDWATELLK